jgi:MFS family permease
MSAVLAAAYLSGISNLVVNVQPIVLGALADGYHLGDGALGQIGAVYIGFSSLSSLTAPLWIRRVNWRWTSLLAVVPCVALMALGAATSQTTWLLILFALIGAAQGAVAAPVFAALGDNRNPERAFAISIVVQSVIASGMQILLASYVVPRAGAHGMFISLAIAMASAGIAAMWLPARGRIAEVPSPQHDRIASAIPLRAALPCAVALLALGLFTAGLLGFWYFVERIGTARGMAHGTIGLALGLGSIANVASSGLVAWLGGRTTSRVPIAAGSLILLLAFIVLQFDGDAAYIACNMMFSFGFGLAQPAYLAVVRKVDATNRLFVAAGGVFGVAGVAIGLVAGPIIGVGGYKAMILMAAGFVIAGAVLLGVSAKIRAPAPAVLTA